MTNGVQPEYDGDTAAVAKFKAGERVFTRHSLHRVVRASGPCSEGLHDTNVIACDEHEDVVERRFCGVQELRPCTMER